MGIFHNDYYIRLMNGRQRIEAMIEGGKPDSLPLMPITMMAAADLIGEKYGKYAADYRTHVRGQVAISEKYDIDYVSAISDPAVEAHDCGGSIVMYDDQPPAIDERIALLAEKKKLKELRVPDPAGGKRMSNRLNVVSALKDAAGQEKLVEGWIEGPCAEAADLRGLNTLMLDFFDDPPFIRDLLEFVFEMEMSFAKAQVEAGADIIGVGDAAASLIGPDLYAAYVFPLEKRYAETIHSWGAYTRLHICGNTTPLLKMMSELSFDIVDIDFLVPFEKTREKMGRETLLTCNIDPVRMLRNGRPSDIVKELQRCYGIARPRFVVGAGCEVVRDTPEENFKLLTRFARETATPSSSA
jgi:MtaA/CmuA family methyltransferase